MIEVAAKDLGKYIGKHFIYVDNILGHDVEARGVVAELNPIEDSFGLGDYSIEYTDNDGDFSDFLVHGHKIFQITE